MRVLGPFTLPAINAPDTVTVGAQYGLAVGVEVSNLSGSLLRIKIGNRIEWLPAYRVDRFPMGDETTIEVAQSAIEIPNTSENQYLIAVAYLNDAPDYLTAFPGTYPADITRNVGVTITAGSVSITGTPAVTVTSGSVSINNVPSVTVAGGTVNIGNTPAVTISGTATVAISGTPTVAIAVGQSISITGTPTVSISGTPTVSISGTPTVILGAGTASIGSVSAISSTVTVAGTVNIGNTPAVTITGTPNVNIASGTVNIGGTPNINIASQSVIVSTSQPQTQLTDLVFPVGQSTQVTDALAAGTHALELGSPGNAANFQGLIVTGHTSGIQYYPPTSVNAFFTDRDLNTLTGARRLVIPVNPLTDSQYDVSANNTTAGAETLHVTQILDTEAVWVANSPQTPIFIAISQPDGQAPLPVDTAGREATYRSAVSFTIAAGANDVFRISAPTVSSLGQPTIVCIKRIRVTITATTATLYLLSLIKRNAANTGGTFVVSTIVPLDSGDGASIVTSIGNYTANPTVGTAVGVVANVRTIALVSPNLPQVIEWEFGANGSKPLYLHVNSLAPESLCISVNGATIPGGTMAVEIEWSDIFAS